jgi:DNA-binding NtrC family response regulator
MMQPNQALQEKVAEVIIPCVLLVDDDPQTLSSLGRALRKEPYQLLSTTDPWKALEWIKSREVDLLITDEFMPGLLGTDLLEALRLYSPATATILLTGYPKPVVAYRGFQQRMGLFLAKPWEDQALREASLRLLREQFPRGVFQKTPGGRTDRQEEPLHEERKDAQKQGGSRESGIPKE